LQWHPGTLLCRSPLPWRPLCFLHCPPSPHVFSFFFLSRPPCLPALAFLRYPLLPGHLNGNKQPKFGVPCTHSGKNRTEDHVGRPNNLPSLPPSTTGGPRLKKKGKAGREPADSRREKTHPHALLICLHPFLCCILMFRFDMPFPPLVFHLSHSPFHEHMQKERPGKEENPKRTKEKGRRVSREEKEKASAGLLTGKLSRRRGLRPQPSPDFHFSFRKRTL